MIKKSIDDLLIRFKANIPLNAKKDSCWPWLGSISSNGYGKIGWNKKTLSAHKLSYMIYRGAVPKGYVVRHTCDNPCCVNPEHLIIGTSTDNAIDAIKRERRPEVKLNSEAVKVIRWMMKYKNVHGLAIKLAKLYQVDSRTIRSIRDNLTWKHIQV